jgi:hypothetical protein
MGSARATLLVIAGIVSCAIAAIAPAAEYNLRGGPSASFIWFPQTPRVNETVSLVSTSTDFHSPIRAYAWDLSDNGPFGAFVPGAQITKTSFFTPAPHTVRLRVTDAQGASDITAETIRMSKAPPGVISPFPIVRIVGILLRSGVKLRVFAVKAPRSATIRVTCRSRACPTRLRARATQAGGRGRRFTTFHAFQRRLGAGVKLEVRVSQRAKIGAYTMFQIRRRRIPLRRDTCLDTAGVRPIACPSS